MVQIRETIAGAETYNAQRAGQLNLTPLGLLTPLGMTDYWLVTYYRSKLSHWRG